MVEGSLQLHGGDKDGARFSTDVLAVKQKKDLVVASHDKDGDLSAVRVYEPAEIDLTLLSAWDKDGNFSPICVTPPPKAFANAFIAEDRTLNPGLFMDSWSAGIYSDGFNRGALIDADHPWDDTWGTPAGDDYEIGADPDTGSNALKIQDYGWTGAILFWTLPVVPGTTTIRGTCKVVEPADTLVGSKAYAVGIVSNVNRFEARYVFYKDPNDGSKPKHYLIVRRYLGFPSSEVLKENNTDGPKSLAASWPAYHPISFDVAAFDNGQRGVAEASINGLSASIIWDDT